MKITGTTIINILFSLSAICAVELASSSRDIPHVHEEDWHFTSYPYFAKNFHAGEFDRELSEKDLVIGPEGFALVVSKGAKPGTLLISNHSTQKVEYKIEDLNVPPKENERLLYRCMYGKMEPNQKQTIDATHILFRINREHYIPHVPEEKWHLATFIYLPNSFKAGEYRRGYGANGLVMGTEGSALVVSESAEPNTLLISNHSTRKVVYLIQDLNYENRPQDKSKLRWYRCLEGSIEPNEKWTISATGISLHIQNERW
ncbi:hypothetical protein PCASD_22455 [Puccinia coronata f. sp. avenae]|uniref:Uncharacterized protein n=1 Tax=Puccinia coronata f. sp. avenae TaxID=200324 RepID=A0A2N5TIS5_9BASI|nr:hypothetical protein PCASD_22455 [Puccinia coronata f. sp. avenae]